MTRNEVTAKKPGKELAILYGAEAVPNMDGPGFVGIYRAPGLAPGMVRDPETDRVRHSIPKIRQLPPHRFVYSRS